MASDLPTIEYVGADGVRLSSSAFSGRPTRRGRHSSSMVVDAIGSETESATPTLIP